MKKMNYRKTIFFIFIGFVSSILFATSANAFNSNIPSCQVESSNESSIVVKIEKINIDKVEKQSSIQAICITQEKKIYKNIVIVPSDIKPILTELAKGDHVILDYKGGTGQTALKSFLEKKDSLQNLTIFKNNLDLWWALAALFISMFVLWTIGVILLSWNPNKTKAPIVKGWLGVINGLDNRFSNSKMQVTVWFFILISSYIATTGVRIYFGGLDFIGGVIIPQNLLLLSGLSAFTFVAAKGITQSKVDQGASQKVDNSNGKPNFTNLFRDDDNNIDLSDFQMVIVTLLAVVVYSIQIINFLSNIELRHTVYLPDLDTTIVSLFGLGQGSFLAKKAISPASNPTKDKINKGDNSTENQEINDLGRQLSDSTNESKL